MEAERLHDDALRIDTLIRDMEDPEAIAKVRAQKWLKSWLTIKKPKKPMNTHNFFRRQPQQD